jgi:hypothetical protein
MFVMYVENLSGKSYGIDNKQEKNPPVLEMKKNGKWEKVEYQHVNAGLIFGWTIDRNAYFLDEPLAPGRYRIRISLQVFERPGSTAKRSGYIEAGCEFDVAEYANAPKPKWEISRLKLSPYDAKNQSAGVSMSLSNPVLNKNDKEFEVIIMADTLYSFGAYYTVEVLLDGKWYVVPFAHGGVHDICYYIGFDDENRRAVYPCFPVEKCGILPAGQYRLIKDFDSHELSKEFAIAEFTAEELLESEFK